MYRSVVASKRGHSKFEPVIKAQIVAKHIIIITRNEKIFDVSFKALTEDIIHSAENIFIHCYTANNIYASGQENFEQRIKLETMAILECKSLLALIDLAHQVFHLKSKKVEYVAKIIGEAEQSIQSWRKSDKERLKEIQEKKENTQIA
jgi:hypothetical protein